MNIPKVIEGLNCCSMLAAFRDCEACPYYQKTLCIDTLLNDALEAIQKMDVKPE